MNLYRLGESPELVCLCDVCARDRFVLGEGEPLIQADRCQDCGSPWFPVPARPDPKPEKRHKATRTEWEGLRAEKLSFRLCRVCEERPASELHHLVGRDLSGDDCAANLVGLCSFCHKWVEERHAESCSRLRLALTDAEIEYVIAKKGEDFLSRYYPAIPGVAA